MRIGYIDCIGGVSGDMLLGALVSSGASESAILDALDVLHLPQFELRFESTSRCGLAAVKAQVTTQKARGAIRLTDLLDRIESSDLSGELKDPAERVLRRLGEAEAQVHGTNTDELHLHELGSDDTLVDIVGVLAGMKDLGLETIYSSPLPVGRGWIESAHGPLPLPAPATLNLLKGIPIEPADTDAELVTPTGAALLSEIVSSFGGFPEMTVRGVGHGAGARELEFPNIVRLVVGEAADIAGTMIRESLLLLETNIDDMSPQVYGHAIDRLFSAGALDVTLVPIQMKKNRPGAKLSVLCRHDRTDDLLDVIFSETTTLGVRRLKVERMSLPRSIKQVSTPYGRVRVKVATWKGAIRGMPEFDDCRTVAVTSGVAVREVWAAAQEAFRRLEE